MLYTVGNFRKNIRHLLNEVSFGNEVIIERYGQKFAITALNDGPPVEAAKLRGKDPQEIETISDVVEDRIVKQEAKVVLEKKDPVFQYCEHGAGKGFCKKKTCKFSKR